MHMQKEEAKTVNLKNGTQSPEAVVAVVHVGLTGLLKQGIPGVLALYDLTNAARIDGGKVTDSQALKILAELSLVNEDGTMHDEVKNVVINSIEGEGMKMHIVSPLQPKP